MGSKSAVEICCQKRIEKVLEHFEISYKELSETEPFSAIKNNPNTRKAYGIDRIWKNKKFRRKIRNRKIWFVPIGNKVVPDRNNRGENEKIQSKMYKQLYIKCHRKEVMILKKAQEITYSNWIRIGDKTVRLEELSKEERVEIANRLTYRFLSALPNVKVVESN